MDIELKDLKIDKIRKEISMDNDGLHSIKVYNAIGHERDILLKELLGMVDKYSDEEFVENWYKYLIENFTNVKNGKMKIRTLLESPKIEFLHLKRSLDEMVNEVYLDMLLSQINNLENEKISVYAKVIEDRIDNLKETAKEMENE